MVYHCVITVMEKLYKCPTSFLYSILDKTFGDFLVFTTIEMEPDYYHQKVNVRVASRVAKQILTFFGK